MEIIDDMYDWGHPEKTDGYCYRFRDAGSEFHNSCLAAQADRDLTDAGGEADADVAAASAVDWDGIRNIACSTIQY